MVTKTITIITLALKYIELILLYDLYNLLSAYPSFETFKQSNKYNILYDKNQYSTISANVTCFKQSIINTNNFVSVVRLFQ